MLPHVPTEHRALRRRWFTSAVPLTTFSTEERALLREYGVWLEGLADGGISPFTDSQRRFVAVAKGHAQPLSKFEKLWLKYTEVVNAQKQAKRDEIHQLVASRSLSAPQLQAVLDNRRSIGLSAESCSEIEIQLCQLERRDKEGRPTLESALAVYSTTDGQ